MKINTHSISFKIWKTMVLTIGLFLLAILIINSTVIKHYKEDLSYQQLEDAAKFKHTHSKKYDDTTTDNTIFITHFGVTFEYDEPLYHVDGFTSSIYTSEVSDAIFSTISAQIDTSSRDSRRGSATVDDTTYIYYIQWVDDANQAIIYFSPQEDKDNVFSLILGLFASLLLISFFTSNHVAKKLAKPIQELEVFAEEIAKRNWKASLPSTYSDEIDLLAQSLKNMQEALKIAEERDRQFLQSTSHDLKTPVMIIKGYAQSLIDGIHIESDQSVAVVIKKESERLERRITQLLRLNTLGHSLEYTATRDYVSIDRILTSLIQRCKVLAPHLNWNIQLSPYELLGDAESLLIAFENIIENQLRFAKSTITVKMIVDKETTILIENDGEPFKVKDPMILFDSYKKDEDGKFGLGLAIVKQVITAHKGSVQAYNTESGVAFKILLQDQVETKNKLHPQHS
jgi:two-component system sensor histidine kinase CssS